LCGDGAVVRSAVSEHGEGVEGKILPSIWVRSAAADVVQEVLDRTCKRTSRPICRRCTRGVMRNSWSLIG